MGAAARAEAIASHAHRAAQSPQGRHVIAEHSSHYIPVTEPDVVVREIAKIIPSTENAGYVLVNGIAALPK
ncbi:hypothetical protein ABZ942_18035 [Nocardia sp. NPDC046473]|uniref:hypothetical protein n=1 Tax=Nocardia sp. NPDC046473 TaxID=3155733 RepID=UPI00340C02DB